MAKEKCLNGPAGGQQNEGKATVVENVWMGASRRSCRMGYEEHKVPNTLTG